MSVGLSSLAVVVIICIVALWRQEKRDKEEADQPPLGSIICTQATYDEIGPERLRAELNEPHARVIVDRR